LHRISRLSGKSVLKRSGLRKSKVVVVTAGDGLHITLNMLFGKENQFRPALHVSGANGELAWEDLDLEKSGRLGTAAGGLEGPVPVSLIWIKQLNL
jgi:hypothetical protein